MVPEALLLAHCFHKKIIIKRDIKDVGFSSKLRRGVGVRVGDKNIGVEAGKESVHGGSEESPVSRAKI